MNEIASVIILGIVQGLTEFLPISSSGHLIFFREFLSIQQTNDLAFDAVLQLATTLAVFVYFRNDILQYIENFFLIITKKGDLVQKKDKILLYAIVVGTIPGVIAGLMLESSMETIFRNSALVAFSLIFGALVMLAAEKVVALRVIKKDELTVKKGLLIGCFQALALVPGFSRSGMTISGGLFSGLSREAATRFSFLLAFPILVGSGAKKIIDLAQEGVLLSSGLELLAGSVAAFVVGIIAIHFLLSYLKNNTLHVFIWYRIALAIVILVIF